MRNGNLTPEKIYECIFTNQIEKIPESQYNFSTQKKYLDTGEYIMMSNGNRYYNLKRWIKERFIYCDTLFEYSPTTARYITLRSGVEGSTYLDIQTYYPMYVTVEWRNQADGSGRQTLKVGRNETVRLNGVVQAKDQEVMIYGAEHLKNLGRMDGLKPRHLLLNNAYRLTSVECPNNTELINIQIEQCSYLQRIDLRGCNNLGSLSSSQVLDVSGCSNLRYLDTYGTIITSINTNQFGGNLVEIYVPTTLQALSLKNQYSLEIIGLPSSDYLTNSRLRQLKTSASNLSSFSLINCPKVKIITNATSFNLNGSFFDRYGNERRNSEMASLSYATEWNNLMLWGNGLANCNDIYIENSCNDITSMSFRCTSNLQYLTLRNLPNLKTVMLGANCNGNRRNSENNNNQADRLDVKGEFDWENFIVKDCPNIENFYIHEMYSCWDTNEWNNFTFFNFKEGTNSINLAEKFPNLKTFECNLATQNIHQFILPTTLESFINLSWHDNHDDEYPLEWVMEKYNIDSVYFNGEHTDDYVCVYLGNHAMHDVRITAPYTHEIIGLNIKNEWVNPIFNKYKEDGHETRPSVIPYGKIDVSEFKGRNVSSGFAYMDFTLGNCEIIYPDDWDAFLRNIENADTMFYRCTNPDFTWEFAMKFFGKINDGDTKHDMYAYAQLKEQTDFETDGVEMTSNRQVFYYDYYRAQLRGANLKYVKSLTLTNSDGCMGLFYRSNLVKIGDCSFTGTNGNWTGSEALFADCDNLEEVGNITSYRDGTSGRTLSTHAMFRNCSKLTKLGRLTLAPDNADNMFLNCNNLTDENINIYNTSLMTRGNNMFRGCYSLRNAPINDYSSLTYGDSIYRDCINLQTIHLEGIDRYSPLQNANSMFRGCTSLTSVTISGETLPIRLREMNNIYNNCINLRNVIPIPMDFSYDVSMESACGYCYSLTDDTIYKEIPYRVTNISYLYGYCRGLTNPVVNVASDNVNATRMFQYCNNIQTLTVNFNGRLLRESMYFAEHCDNLRTVNLKFPEALAIHDYYETGVAYYSMFRYCENLNYVNLDMTSLSATNARADFGEMFYQTTHIKEIHGLDLTYLKPYQKPLTNNGQNAYEWHNDSITYGANFQDLTTFDVTGLLNTSYNFRNINTITHTKAILRHLDTVNNETLGLTYNIMDAIDDALNEYVDPELKTLATEAMEKGWTFIIV